jgi:phage terminase large subunit GpA-like protein
MLNRIRKSVIDKLPSSGKPIPGGLQIRLLDTIQMKNLIHWRLSRKEGESQRFHVNRDTGRDYIQQLFSEERRRKPSGKVEWVQIRKDNHLLDAECYAAACADAEWTPSLQSIAHQQKKPRRQRQAKGPNPFMGRRF